MVAVDNYSYTSSNSASGTLSLSHSISYGGSSSARYLFIGCATRAVGTNGVVNSAKYNSKSLQLAVSFSEQLNPTEYLRNYIWFIADKDLPALSGVYTGNVNVTGPTQIVWGIISFFAAKQNGLGERSTAGNVGTSPTYSHTVTAKLPNSIVVQMLSRTDSGNISHDIGTLMWFAGTTNMAGFLIYSASPATGPKTFSGNLNFPTANAWNSVITELGDEVPVTTSTDDPFWFASP